MCFPVAVLSGDAVVARSPVCHHAVTATSHDVILVPRVATQNHVLEYAAESLAEGAVDEEVAGGVEDEQGGAERLQDGGGNRHAAQVQPLEHGGRRLAQEQDRHDRDQDLSGTVLRGGVVRSLVLLHLPQTIDENAIKEQ